MDLNKLIKELAPEESGKVNLTITLADFKGVISELRNSLLENKVDDSLRREEKESEDTYLTPDQVCKMMQISQVTLWKLDKKGDTRPIKITGGIKRYRKSDVDYLLSVKIK